MENQKDRAALAKKRLNVESKIGYLKAEGKTANGGKSLELNAIYHKINPLMVEQGLKLETEIVSKSLSSLVNQKQKDVFITEVELRFTWIDTETGYSESKQFHGAWNNYDNYGFAIGSILTYFKRQYLVNEFNIESDETDPSVYEEKHLSVDEKAELTAKKMQTEKEQALVSLSKVSDKSELKFTWDGINKELTKDQQLKDAYVAALDRINLKELETLKTVAELKSFDVTTKKRYTNKIEDIIKKLDK